MSRNKIATIAALSTVWPTIALPQGIIPGAGVAGLQYNITLDSSVTFDDNLQLTPKSKGNSWIWDTDLGFIVSKATDRENLLFSASTVLRFADIPGRTINGFEDPRIRLAYGTRSKNSRLTFDILYRSVDREFLDPFQVELESQFNNNLIADGGTVNFLIANLLWETGINAPFGTVVTLGYNDETYQDVTNSSLFDNLTQDAALSLRFDVSPVTSVSANVAVNSYTADDRANTDRLTTDLFAGLTYDQNGATVWNANLGYTYIDETKFGNDNNQSGLLASLGVVRTVPNGTVSGDVDIQQTVNGQRFTAQAGRSLTLPLGTLSGTFGLTSSEADSVNWIGSLAYNRQLKSSNFSVYFDRVATLNSNDQDVIDSRLGATYGYNINNISSLDVSFNYGLSEQDGVNSAPTVKRTNLTAAYVRNLTKDWDLASGVTLRTYDDNKSGGFARSNSVFLSIGRNWSFQP